ncbi:MAG TPA: bifunctional glycosyltransferase/class I SAM-dependent methyltransferase [Candidatus Binatia bacterium]|jgi:2-polyprenyl-3-methyl-5-hydroxy-6-metoxy-1,4-benzoquinol methylase
MPIEIEIVVPYDDPKVLRKWFLRSSDLDQAKLFLIENEKNRLAVPSIFNNHRRTSKAEWIIFCDQNFVVHENGWLNRIRSLEPIGCYGPIGIDARGNFLGQVSWSNGKVVGQSVALAEVSALDEMCIILPRSTYEQVEFDESLEFDFYVADYCIQARNLGYGSRILNLKCQHGFRALMRDTESAKYLNAKHLFLEKYRNLRPLLTTTFQLWPRRWCPPENSPALRVELELIGNGKRVLEVGPGGGHMTEALSEKGCSVTCIEIDPELSERARPFCQKIFIGDIEQIELDDKIGGQLFDVILLGDVLEHLKDPDKVLRDFRKFLRPAGFLVVSLPNVAHASIRLALLNGGFPYGAEGLLDRTHLRFFTLKNIVALFQETDYKIVDLRRMELGFFDTEIPVDPLNAPLSVLKRLLRDPEVKTYQYVFRAVLGDNSAEDGHASWTEGLSHLQWRPRKERNRLASEYRRRGIRFYRSNRLPEARSMLRRSLLIKFRVKTLAFLIASTFGIRGVHWGE